MKKLKIKLYRVLNTLNGEDVVINFKPTKSELVKICKQHCFSGGDEENIKENINAGYYDVHKIEVFCK